MLASSLYNQNSNSTSPFFRIHSPHGALSTFLLGTANQNQAVPNSPSLSPLVRARGSNSIRTLPSSGNSQHTYRPYSGEGHSPAAAIVPEAGERTFSGSPLLRQILTVGRKRQRDTSPGPGYHSIGVVTTPSPIVTTSKRFCGSGESGSVVIVERGAATIARTRSKKSVYHQEQVVPNCSPLLNTPLDCKLKDIPASLKESKRSEPLLSCGENKHSRELKQNMRYASDFVSQTAKGPSILDCQRNLPENKNGTKLFELFTGDDIFAQLGEE